MAKENTVCKIVQREDPVLRAKAKTVRKEDIGSKELTAILAQMADALEGERDGVAIAAPQIGVSLRIFVVSHRAFEVDEHQKSKDKTTPPEKQSPPKAAKNMVCINPEIIKISKKKVKVPEGCLSVRWLYGNTMRSEKATIRACDENGKSFTYGGSGLIAQIFQHETDHLNGILFIDHATDVEEMLPEQIEEIKNGGKKKGG